MKIYELFCNTSCIASGNSSELILRLTNKEKINELAEKLNKKHESENNEVYCIGFDVEEIDTNEIKDSLSEEELNKLLKG